MNFLIYLFNKCQENESIIYLDMVVNTFTQMKWCKNDGEAIVEFPDDMLIPDSDDHVGSIIQETYPELTL